MATTDTTWDYTNPREYVRRFRRGLQDLPPLVISVAITGAEQGAEINPNLPETPQAQAQSTYEAWSAGASIVHIHARRASNLSKMAEDTERYLEVNQLVRDKCPDIIINNTMVGDVLDTPSHGHEVFVEASLYANPEMSSLDLGPVAGKTLLKKRLPPLSGRDTDVVLDNIFLTTYGETERLAQKMRELGIKPELELFNSGQFSLVDNLIDLKLVDKPYWLQFVLGADNANYATPMDLLHMINRVPNDSLFSVIGTGGLQLPMNAMAIVMGGHVRVGMEDNVYYRRGELATSNAQFVERIVRLARELGREVATPTQARQMLGLAGEPRQYSGQRVTKSGANV